MHVGHPDTRGGICHKLPTAQVCPLGVTGALHDLGRHLPLLEDRVVFWDKKEWGNTNALFYQQHILPTLDDIHDLIRHTFLPECAEVCAMQDNAPPHKMIFAWLDKERFPLLKAVRCQI